MVFNYRYRLRNEFLTLGMDGCGKPSGKMIPSGKRYYNMAPDKISVPVRSFGDGTSYLGNYMAVLATEYALLKRNANTPQYQLDSLKKELFWAMMAYERLDRNGFNTNFKIREL